MAVSGSRQVISLPSSFIFSKLIHSSPCPNQKYNNVEQKCKSMRQVLQLQAHFITSGSFFLQDDPFPASRILKLSADLGALHFHYTLLLFRRIPSPDAFCINTLIKAYSTSSSHPQQALPFFFDFLSKGFLPNSFTFPPLFICCSKLQASTSGQICHAQAIKHGLHTPLPVQNSLIHMYATFGLIHSASHLFDTMSHRDFVSWNSIIHAYVQMRDLTVAHRLFDQMPIKNVVSWNIIMSGYLTTRNPGCVLKLFRQLVMEMGFRGTSDTTIVNVVTACGRSARLREGMSVHGSFLKNSLNCNSSLILNTALIDMYSKCRRLEAARTVFDGMLVKRNLICWNAMILGYSIHGCPQQGISLFTTMVGMSEGQQVLVPDEVTFIGLLCACARAGLLSEGRNYFSQMSSLYGIKPKFAHYWCMANLYYGAGLVQEAEHVLRSMPEYEDGSSSESLVLSSLLASCRFQGDSVLAERIALHLIELEPQNASRYKLLLNVYAVAGRWEEVGTVKKFIKEKGIRTTPGCSLLDLNEVVHEFEVADKSLDGKEDVYSTMNELALKLGLPPIKWLHPMESKWVFSTHVGKK